VIRAITSIPDGAWTPIRYPNAIYDEDEQRWISDAEVAEVEFTAFTGRRRAEQVIARLIVRRVRRLNPATAPTGKISLAGKQGELFAVYRYHAVFTNSPEPMLDAEATHRDHAIIEQVIAELKNGPLAHLPSGRFAANAAWLACATMAHNLTRAAGALAGGQHRRARTGTIRARLIATPPESRTPRTGRSCTCLATGPTSPDSTSCSAAPCTTRSRPPLDHRPRRARPEITSGNAGQTGRSPTPTVKGATSRFGP
jgi:hypothetical protein